MDFSVILKLVAVGIVTALCGMLLKKAGKEEIATVLSIAGLVVAFVILLDMLAQLYDTFKSLFEL